LRSRPTQEVLNVTRKAPVLRIALVAILAVLILVPAAVAAKGGKNGGGTTGGGTTGSGGSLSLVMITDLNGDTLPNYGDTVTFHVSTTVTSSPYVLLGCTQGGVSVYKSSYLVGFFPGYPWPWLQNFLLSSQTWTGGAANCTATLEYNTGSKWAVIGSLNFNVAA